MLQFSQLCNIQFFNAILVVMCIAMLVIFINLIIKSFIQKDKPTHPAFLITAIVFFAFTAIWSILCFVPVVSNAIFPSDSQQIVSIINNSNYKQKILLAGRLSYSNEWTTIIPFYPELQGSPIVKLEPNQKTNIKIRTGIRDIDYLIAANVSKTSYSKNPTGIVVNVPKNDIVLYTNPMNTLTQKPTISILLQIVNLTMYLAAIIGLIWLFLLRFNSIEEKKITPIILFSIAVAIPAAACGLAFWSNLQDLILII